VIFASTMVYALGKELGFVDAEAEFNRQLEDPTSESLPAVRMIHRLRHLDSVGLHVDAAATSIPRARCRAFDHAEKSLADFWFSVDDDCECDTETAKRMLEAAREEQAVILAPYLLRGTNEVSCMVAPDALERVLPSGARLIASQGGGFGLVCMPRSVMLKLSLMYSSRLGFRDTDGKYRIALFHEQLSLQSWLGEDVSFCRLAIDAGVPVWAVGTGVTRHCHQRLDLELVRRPPAPDPDRLW
jgi:hypothetical protein